MTEPHNGSYARELADIHRAAQERLGVRASMNALNHWSGVNLAAPSTKGGWFARLLSSTIRLRRLSRRLAGGYYNLARALETERALPDPLGEYGDETNLDTLFNRFDEHLRAVSDVDQLEPATAEEALEKAERLQDRFDDLEDALRSAFDELRMRASTKVPLSVDNDFEWPDEEDDADIAGDLEEAVADILDDFDRRLTLIEADEAERDEPARIREALLQEGESTAYKVAGVTDQAALTAGRDFIEQSGGQDRLVQGWQRVTGPSPCAFCAMLASRGAVFASAERAQFTAGKGVKENRRILDRDRTGTAPSGLDFYHPNCHCHVIPVWRAEPHYTVRDQFFKDNWGEVTKSVDGKDKLRTWRQWLTKQYRAGLVPDQGV